MAPQDSFIEEEEDTCPLCIEEFDLSDRNFRPCPCGYQVCQFCFNNIKNNMNGLCPACRRPYDEKTIQWKVVTQEEVAEFRANIQKNQKKRATDQRQKELQKREAEKENRKNLIGVRVVQKNLVYITGLAPTVREDELLKTLRKPEFFGQYGNIQKISISNRKSSDGQHQSLGIYVTFERPEEATRCITAVHGSQNGDRVLKAQHGTTKYCSAWLKNEKCSNPGCMFLHEQGDEEDSYSRQDLSSMNSIASQRPLPGGGSRSASRQQAPHPTPPPVVSHPMARSISKEGSENGADGSALPSSANWARNPQRSRRGSLATSGAASSPAISMAQPVTAEPVPEEAVEEEEEEELEEDEPQPEEPVAGPSNSRSRASESPAPSKSFAESGIREILKALQNCPWPVFSDTGADQYPPLFDPRGGEKRRAMREEEDSRLSGEQEERTEAREPSEGEPETGGSLALGGEPEDRDVSNDNRGFDRRGSTQPPIQRLSTDGLFGPALTGASPFGQGSGNPGSRSMTPQQLFLRSQSGFADAPPGIANQSNAFQNQNQSQGQGHNRQSSRFSFANDNASSTSNVKVSANPRIMAQQSSMMPNTFQSQGSNQFYGASMPGPPPGLKSTGTPPNMFGQFGGQGFGAPKDNSNELLQSLIGRSRAGNNQSHDAGKREFMISSFSNQYPPSSTSTPAPAPGLLPSLYGGTPSAYQDMNSKQKKKGKKHRHANTSSSGGSGLVDLADPSILQARMQHQSQGSTGVGQGLFGGQSQDDELPSLDEATNSVDALVSDDPILPTIGFEGRQSVPPGLTLPPGLPPISRPPSTASHGRLSNLVPALPKMPPPGLSQGALTPDQSPMKSKPATPVSEVKKTLKSSAAESGLSKEIAAESQPKQSKGISLQDEDFPALDTLKSKSRPATPTAKPTPKAKRNAERIVDRMMAKAGASKESSSGEESKPQDAKLQDNKDQGAKAKDTKVQELKPQETKVQEPKPTQSTKVAEKKPISVNTQVEKNVTPKSGESPATTEKPTPENAAAFPPLPAPSSIATPSPVTRTGPKTLRVVATPKTEAPPPASPALTMASVALSGTSRGVSASYRPDTPASSEVVSDNASVVSASVTHSRASSPPPSRIGSAAVRTTTKSQQRKARKDVLKQETKMIAEAPKAEPEVHAPILGRKKKQKKEKPAKTPQSDTTPGVQEPAKLDPPTPESPQPEPTKEPEREPEEKPAKSKTAQKKAAKAKGKAKEIEPEPAPQPPSPAKETTPEVQEPPEKQGPGPASVFAEIKNTLWASSVDKLQLFKPIAGGSSRTDYSSANSNANKAEHCKDCSCKCGEIQDDDLAALRAGKPVRKQFHVDGSRMLITPNGDCIRGLTPEEEDAFLELQAAIAGTAENPGSFIAPRHQPGSGAFSLIKGRAVPNGRPNIFPTTAQVQSQDPIGKLQREDALSYINQYVLPRLNLGATNMGFPKGASPTKDAAAASLNSLAPYFYGPDAAAGVGIYSPPDGARAMQDFSSAGMSGEERGKNFGMGVGGMPLMSVEDAEGALAIARRETEKLEKGLNQVIRRNRRLVLGGNN
ncbi:transcriptional repressor general negative regulator of transcription subunit 4 [Fusarium equiseti]|uniref:Transcriptional repressor general negative regulator of transcription subunit 4 n=1 Tax=Fusarium equiseti TaxID=61235 RepID=A0ABQ8RDE4_FUSEQ|nr:transcriptional repressor general negative regulator of transcription subunit 4 [Fusarium equiseti]